MTISTTTIKNSYSGNGSTTVFNYTFKITDEDHITVIIRTDSTGAETTKTKTTHYTVSGVGNAGGGSVTFTSGNEPASGETVVLRRDTPQTQGMDLIENDPLPANTLETAHDKIMSVAQELQEEVNRSIKLSRTNTMTSTEFTVGATDRANKILSFDASGELAITQELGTYKGTDATVTTAAYVVRDIIKSTTTAQLNNVYICVADSVIGDSLTDTDHFELLVDAVSAATSATSASTSATAAASSATAAASSASAASTSETNAASSASTASTKASEASTSASNASTSESNASTSETNAASSATAAASSATSASSSATTATTKASEASTSATNAASSATSASNSASTATTKASEAATSATNAATSETNAGTSETNAASSATAAASSATSASGSATTATTKASEASTSASNAATSASNASTSETNAASSATSASGSASTATTKASEAATSATNAASSASTATTKASEASTSASNAATSATNAASSATSAATSATNAANSFDDFDDTYLGAKASDPTQDNDGDALATGMLYTNTTSGNLRYYNGSAWVNISTGLTSVSGDTSPSLGGDLGLNSNDITGTGNINITGSVTATSFSGDGSSLTGITSVGGATGVDFNDSVKARFGTGNDLEIFHNGTNSIIENKTGDLILRTPDAESIFLRDAAGNNLAQFNDNGAVNLYHNALSKLSTTSTGVSVTGNIVVSGTVDGRDVATDGTKLDGIATGATANTGTVTSVSGGNGLTGSVTTSGSLNVGAGTGIDVGVDTISVDVSDFMANGANNRVVTATGTDGMNAEANMTFDGTTLSVPVISTTGNITAGGNLTSDHVLPNTTDTYDLGSSSKVWRNIYTGDLHLSNEAKEQGNAVDGTKGNWTIQEGAEDLYILNNKTGKKFKFKLEEIS